MERYALIHPERPARRATAALVVALTAHAILYAAAVRWERAAVAAARAAEGARPKEVTLARLEPAQWERNRSVAQTFVPSAAFDTRSDQLARPERARFLSDRDRRVEKETVAKPAPGMPGRPAASSAPAHAPAAEQAPARLPQGDAVAMARGVGGEPIAPGEGSAPRPGTPGPDLQPRPVPAKPLVMSFDVKGEGGVPDIDGVAVGNLTVLNAEAWRYATFFDRVGATLYGVWRVEFIPRPPVPSIAARPGGGTVRIAYGVTLDSTGRAVEVTVRRSSGLADVDALLAELIQRSAPFPNVPPGLLEGGKYSDIWIISLVWGWRGR